MVYVPTGRPRGRPVGAVAKYSRKADRIEAIKKAGEIIEHAIGPDAFGGDAHQFMMAVYKSPKYPLELRLEAAKAAAKYEKPAYVAIQHSGPNGGPIQTVSITMSAQEAADAYANMIKTI